MIIIVENKEGGTAMWEIIDYTKMRKSKKIILCPRCNRKGEITNYTDGSISIKHKAENHKWCLEITDSCFLKKGDLQL